MFLRKWLRSILREHRNHDLGHDIQLCLINSCDLNEDILGIKGNLRVITINDGWQRANGSLRVVDDRVDWRVPDDMEEFAQVLVFLFLQVSINKQPAVAEVFHTS